MELHFRKLLELVFLLNDYFKYYMNCKTEKFTHISINI